MYSLKVLSTQTLPSSKTYEELTHFHLRLPLDPEIDKLLSSPEDLMSYLCKSEIEASVQQINFEAALSKNDDYKTFLSFLLFRLNYAYLQHKDCQFRIESFISRAFTLFLTQKIRSDPTGLRVRLVFVFNVSQGLLEPGRSAVMEALDMIGATPYKIYSPLDKQSIVVAEKIKKILREIIQTSLFRKAVEEFLSFFKDTTEASFIISACEEIEIIPIGIRGVTRVLGMILPDGIALDLKYLSFLESEESFVSRVLVVSMHNIGQYIVSLLPCKELENITPKLGEELLNRNNRGYLFQAILSGHIKYWSNPVCMKKLLTVKDWPASPPLFEDSEQLLGKEQTIRSTFNSSMFLSSPIEADCL